MYETTFRIQRLHTSVVYLERLCRLRIQCAKCQSTWEFYQFSAAIDAAPHLEPTKEPQCCFDKMLCSHCSLSDLFLNKQLGSDSNNKVKRFLTALRSLCLTCCYSVCPVFCACVCVRWILCVRALRFSHCAKLFFFFQLRWWKVCERIEVCHVLLPIWLYTSAPLIASLVVYAIFFSSNSAFGVFYEKSDKEGQQTKLSTTLCRFKRCLKFAHCLHYVCGCEFPAWWDVCFLIYKDLIPAPSVTAWIKFYLYVMIM